MTKAAAKTQQPVAVPPNLQAEQGLLSIVLGDNGAIALVADQLRAEHFAEPFHQVIYTACQQLVSEGLGANPVTLRSRIETHPTYAEAGGDAYLARLAGLGIPANSAGGYARAILENHARRSLVATAEKVIAEATAGSTRLLDVANLAATRSASVVETLAGTTARRTRHTFAQAVAAAIDLAAEAYQNEGVPRGAVMSGIGALDRHIGGFLPGDLVIVAGRPGMGKSAVAGHFAFSAAAAGKPTHVISLEMYAAQFTVRQISAAMPHPKVPYNRIMKGRFNEAEFNAIVDTTRRIQNTPMGISDPGRIPLAAVEAEVTRIKAENPDVAEFVVDYLQLIKTGEGGGHKSRAEEIGDITASLKGLASRLGVVMVVLSQLSRAVEAREDKRPQMSDLRESGAIEQDADIILFPFREEYYLARNEPKPNTTEHIEWQDKMNAITGTMELIIAKFRMGSAATVRCRADMATNSIEDMPEDRQPEMF